MAPPFDRVDDRRVISGSEELGDYGTKPVIPNRCNRKHPFTFNKRLYELRWRIEVRSKG